MSVYFVQARHCFSNMPMPFVSTCQFKFPVLTGICQFANCYAKRTWKAFLLLLETATAIIELALLLKGRKSPESSEADTGREE